MDGQGGGVMGRSGLGWLRRASRGALAVAVALLVVGAALGWLVPRVGVTGPFLDEASAPIYGSGIDSGAYLGALLTALAVLIAVVIGYSAVSLQIAGEAHSLALSRAMLGSIIPFVAGWALATVVALLYFLRPPEYAGQLWQLLCWFIASILLMLAYLWQLPWRLSGAYAAHWALRELARQSIAQWESLDGYAVLQTGLSAAIARGDLQTAKAMAYALGSFLVGRRDSAAERAPAFDRSRYRAIKNLLSGAARRIGDVPTSGAYYVGFVLAGTLLQAAAVGLPSDDDDHNLVSGVVRELRAGHARAEAVWTGMRHALCRGDGRSQPYLVSYWRSRPDWPADDRRRVDALAGWMARCYVEFSRVAEATQGESGAPGEMLDDLYRDITERLSPLMDELKDTRAAVRSTELPVLLLDAMHTHLLKDWPAHEAAAERVRMINIYEQRRRALITGPTI